MASKNITFDPTSGVPYAANLTIQGGANFEATFNVVNTSNTPYPFTTAWSANSQIAKSVAVGATLGASATFTSGITTSATLSTVKISLGSTATRALSEGRYVYNVLVSSGSTIYNIVNGNILVYAGVSSAP
tara:strand:- start:758 stop:1150 length:393 start_codon:yes stop_codon:yes gene_type:complete